MRKPTHGILDSKVVSKLSTLKGVLKEQGVHFHAFISYILCTSSPIIFLSMHVIMI